MNCQPDRSNKRGLVKKGWEDNLKEVMESRGLREIEAKDREQCKKKIKEIFN